MFCNSLKAALLFLGTSIYSSAITKGIFVSSVIFLFFKENFVFTFPAPSSALSPFLNFSLALSKALVYKFKISLTRSYSASAKTFAVSEICPCPARAFIDSKTLSIKSFIFSRIVLFSAVVKFLSVSRYSINAFAPSSLEIMPAIASLVSSSIASSLVSTFFILFSIRASAVLASLVSAR